MADSASCQGSLLRDAQPCVQGNRDGVHRLARNPHAGLPGVTRRRNAPAPGRQARSTSQHLPQCVGELPRFLDEAAVATREFNCLRTQPFGKCEASAMCKLAAGAAADPDDQTCGRCRQRGDVGDEARGSRNVVAEEARTVGGPLVQCLSSWDGRSLLRGHPDVGHELPECCRLTFSAERSDNIVHLGPSLRGVWKQYVQWWFVRDEGPHPAPMPGHQCEARNSPAAAAKHVGGVEPKCVQDRGDIVGALLDRRILVGVVQATARDAAWIMGNNRMVYGEGIREWRKWRGTHWRSHDQHYWSGAANLIMQVGTGDVDRVGACHSGLPFPQLIFTIVEEPMPRGITDLDMSEFAASKLAGPGQR